MIVEMRTQAPCGMPLMLVVEDLVGTTVPMHMSRRTIPGTIIAVVLWHETCEFTFKIELPDDDETVASWRRMVGPVLYLSRAGGPESYAELDRILASGEKS